MHAQVMIYISGSDTTFKAELTCIYRAHRAILLSPRTFGGNIRKISSSKAVAVSVLQQWRPQAASSAEK